MLTESPIKNNERKTDNPLIEKEGDIMLNSLKNEDRIDIQKALISLANLSNSLRLEYKDKQKRIEDLNSFKEKLDSLILYLNNIYLLLKGAEIKNIKELEKSDFTEKELSNLNLDLDFKKIDSFTYGNSKSLLNLFSACKNLQTKINAKKQEILNKIEKPENEIEKEKSEIY
jgi:hypothetical protein